MNRFDGLLRWTLSILVVCSLAFALGGCEGDDGNDGAAGAAGAAGPAGPAGPPGEDAPPPPVPDAVMAAIDSAQVESCGTCHGDAGDQHQEAFNEYADASAFTMTFTDFTSTPNGVLFDVSLELSIAKDGVPFTDFAGLEQKSFYVDRYETATREYFAAFTSLNDTVVMVADGDYVISEVGLSFDPTVNGQVYGYIAQGALHLEDEAGHVHLYADVASAAMAWGDAMVTDPDAYQSYANASGCENCHGAPYAKHGYRVAAVDGIPDFAPCKVCHNDDGAGGHEDWQYMVDEPLNWANGVASTADYSYIRNVMNDTHMSHAMEFPYPQSMATCNTCHEGYLTDILDDSQFTAETCMSCHPIQGVDAWPGETYAQSHRAPPFEYLWTELNVQGFHDVETSPNCLACHGAAGVASSFTAYHTGYDATIYDATGQRYADLYPVSIDSVTLAGNLLTINFSGDAAIVPEVLVSLYGWDSKNFIVPSHARDANAAGCPGSHGDGCQMEYVPGDISPLWTTDGASVAGNWMVTLDFAAFQPTNTDDIPTLIANGDVTMAEINIAPELVVGTTDVVLTGAEMTFDLGGSVVVADHFKGANATVDIDKCNACHDTLTSTFHTASGRVGDSIVVCKNCHNPTFTGSHLEMTSRSIDSYVHAIHTFQPFDLGSVDATDPVEVARTDLHMGHGFPTFSITGCEACHVAGTYNVPDQSESMPGVLSASDDIPDRNIGTVAETVTGPASRACGACHRADMINEDLAGDLASFNAHTGAFGTFEENDDEDMVLYGIIDKIMSMFE